MEARAGNSNLDFETLFSDFQELLNGSGLIASASTTICTRFNSRAAPLCLNLNGNLCPTLKAHTEPLPFSELVETRNPLLNKRFGMNPP